jgi:hypothetical protein
MKPVAITAAAFAAILALTPARADDKAEAKGKDVDYDIHSGYFESNKDGLTGDSSYLAFASQKAFDAVFGVARVQGNKQRFLPKDAFDSKVVVGAIKRGNAIYDFKVEKVAYADGVLTLQYTATPQESSGTATFATPLIVSVDKAKYDSVAFIENGKKVATAKFAE